MENKVTNLSISINLVGLKFNKLSVISLHSIGARWQKKWNCICECGNSVIVFGANLKRGHTKSCGCLKVEYLSSILKNAELECKEYRAWESMKSRCYVKTDTAFKNYGSRGIVVCDKWIESYYNFLNDVGRASSSEYSIDRKNVNGNYEPSNCRWATDLQQANNTRRNVIIIYMNERFTMSQLAKKLGVSYGLFHKWFKYKKLSVENIISRNEKNKLKSSKTENRTYKETLGLRC